MATVTPRWPGIVDGRRLDAGPWRDVRSPYSGEVVAEVAWCGADDARAAVDAAARAMAAGLATGERADVLDRISDALSADERGMAEAICREAGKPITLARQEVARAAATFAAAALEARRLTGEMVPLPERPGDAAKLAFTLRRPIGVIGAITPFNFPINLVAHKVAPAIAAGCGMVVKPADKTPGAAVLLAELARDAGLPDGWLNVLAGDPEELAGVLLEDDRVRLISFTGSAAIGWSLAARAPQKRVALELGNVTPAIVAADADLDRAAQRLAAGAFGYAGQACVSVQRVFVERPVFDAFATRMAAAADALVCGDPADEATQVGPLISSSATERLLAWIDEARTGGARVLAGGTTEGPVLRPTVLADTPPGARLACEEAFGPVVCLWPYDDFQEAVARANATPYGLQAGIFTSDLGRIMAAANDLEFGGVIVNDTPSFRRDEMPYGGVKQSGNTREGPARAIREMTEERLVVLEP